MRSVIATVALITLLAGAACTEGKGGKLPWVKGTPQKGLAQAQKAGKNSFLYFTSKG